MRLLRPLCALLLLLASLSVTSCQKPAPIPQEESIAVTYNSIAGCWQLSHLQGVPLSEQTHLYIEFERKEPRFVMWDNLNSMYMVQTTGGFAITQDDEQYILTGWYDYGVGDWSSNYIVSMDAHGDYMFWVRMSDNDQNGEDGDDRMAFKKIDNIPAF